MLFTLLGHPSQVPKTAKNTAFLIDDNWDDWGKFRTMFQLVVFDPDGAKSIPGSVKIGEFGLRPATEPERRPGFRAPTLPDEFDGLDEKYFSLGGNENYYETLNNLPLDLRNAVLKGLRDCAFDLVLFDRAIDEPVMRESLLRDISIDNVRNRYNRLAMGDARLTEFWFEFAFPENEPNTGSPVLTFHVTPHSEPPTNLHVLIGRNGVGKTQCLQRMARTILTTEPTWGEIRQRGSNWNKWTFAGLVFVSFSAFDRFDFPEGKRRDVRASMVSLRVPPTPERPEPATKTPIALAGDFHESFLNCREGLKAIRWEEAIKTLENDPLFAEVEIRSRLNVATSDLVSETMTLFSALSSGHAMYS